MARNRVEYKKNNNRGSGLIIGILVFMLLIVGLHSLNLWKKQTVLEQQRTELVQEIKEQEARKEELAEYRKYVQTDSYAREVAQDKLGLVNEGEIVFKIDKK